MILSDIDIRKSLAKGVIRIEPLPDLEVDLGSCSIDFRLGDTFRVFEKSRVSYIDLMLTSNSDYLTEKVSVDKDIGFLLHPGDFVLAPTLEKLELSDNVAGRLEGRSSLARLGLIVHSTAGLFDPGWSGVPTLELGNLGVLPIRLYPGIRICAFTFHRVSSEVEVPYGEKPFNKYYDQSVPEVKVFGDLVNFERMKRNL